MKQSGAQAIVYPGVAQLLSLFRAKEIHVWLEEQAFPALQKPQLRLQAIQADLLTLGSSL